MYMKRLEAIIKEEWLHTEFCIDDQRKFHMAIQRAYDELEYPPSNHDFIFVLNSIIDDPSKYAKVDSFAKKAEVMFNYYRIVG